jgi:HlyD family secretion protein
MRRRQLVAAVAAGVLLLAGGGLAYAQAQGTSGSYRTAKVAEGDVDQTLALAGTITASARRDLSFGVAGHVAKVSAEPGDTVRGGAVLATLDTAKLKAAVTKAEAALAKAKAQLAADQSSQASTVAAADSASGAGSSGTDSSTSGQPTTPTSPDLTKALAMLKTQQGGVTTAKSAATAAITTAKTELADQARACQDSASKDDDDSTDQDEGDATEPSSACTAALGTVQAAQDAVVEKQDALQAALQALGDTLTAAVATLEQSGAGSGTSGGSGSGSDSSSGSSGGSSGGADSSSGRSSGATGGATVTAATLAQDQAGIDTANAGLDEAEQELDATTLTAPFAGTILKVSVTKGDSVGASDVAVVIVGHGDTTVTTTVTADQISDVKRGQTASVTPAGADQAVSGSVTSIGMLPDTSSNTTTYPVTIELDDDVAAPEGSTASISLVIGTAENVLTVPSSAISSGRRTTASVLTDGKVVLTPVTVGVVGPTRTEITDGLTKGQEVVLADLDADLPSGDGSSTRFPDGGDGFRIDRAGGGGPPVIRRG